MSSDSEGGEESTPRPARDGEVAARTYLPSTGTTGLDLCSTSSPERTSSTRPSACASPTCTRRHPHSRQGRPWPGGRRLGRRW